MDPLRELQQEYLSVKSSNNGSVLSEYLEVMLATTKAEIISFDGRTSNTKTKHTNEENNDAEKNYYETHSSELITIPTLLLPGIKEALRKNTKLNKSTLACLTNQAAKVFSVAEKSNIKENTSEGKKNILGMRVKSFRKSKHQLSPAEERLALKQEKRARLNLNDRPFIGPSNILALDIEIGKLEAIKKSLMFNQRISSNEPSLKKIKAIRISDSLEEAEHKTRREDAIKSMIDTLKREDAESAKSSSIRIAGR